MGMMFLILWTDARKACCLMPRGKDVGILRCRPISGAALRPQPCEPSDSGMCIVLHKQLRALTQHAEQVQARLAWV